MYHNYKVFFFLQPGSLRSQSYKLVLMGKRQGELLNLQGTTSAVSHLTETENKEKKSPPTNQQTNKQSVGEAGGWCTELLKWGPDFLWGSKRGSWVMQKRQEKLIDRDIRSPWRHMGLVILGQTDYMDWWYWDREDPLTIMGQRDYVEWLYWERETTWAVYTRTERLHGLVIL